MSEWRERSGRATPLIAMIECDATPGAIGIGVSALTNGLLGVIAVTLLRRTPVARRASTSGFWSASPSADVRSRGSVTNREMTSASQLPAR